MACRLSGNCRVASRTSVTDFSTTSRGSRSRLGAAAWSGRARISDRECAARKHGFPWAREGRDGRPELHRNIWKIPGLNRDSTATNRRRLPRRPARPQQVLDPAGFTATRIANVPLANPSKFMDATFGGFSVTFTVSLPMADQYQDSGWESNDIRISAR